MRKILIVVCDVVLLALCAAGVIRVSERGSLPFDTRDNGSEVIVTRSSTSAIPIGSVITMLDRTVIRHSYELTFLSEYHSIGSVSQVEYLNNGTTHSTDVTYRPYYTSLYVWLQTFNTFVFFLIGIVVFLRLPEQRTAQVFHHLSISLGVLIAVTTGQFTGLPLDMGFHLEALFIIAYMASSVLFVVFSLLFPHNELSKNRKVLIAGCIAAAVMLGVYNIYTFYHVMYPIPNISLFLILDITGDLQRLFFVAMFFVGLFFIFQTYRSVESLEDKRKLRWVLFGIGVGSLSFIGFYELPVVITGKPLLEEEYVLLLSVVSPIAFAISIVRYKAFDIDLLIKRTTIYAVVIGLLFVFYLGVIASVSALLGSISASGTTPTMIAALLTAVLFEPVRRRVQKVVDRQFFRSQFDVRAEERRLTDEVKTVHTFRELAETTLMSIVSVIPVERIGFFLLQHDDRLELVSHRGFDLLERRGIPFESVHLKTSLSQPVLREMFAPVDSIYEKADDTVFGRWQIAAAFPMKTATKMVSGFIVLGPRLSETRFTTDDVEFLQTAAQQSSIASERIRLHQKLLVEQAESERLVELNRIKTYFVSSISHDLKTPLTSISLFVELMRSNETLPHDERRKYFDIIEGESERLSRLISSVLDFAQIERGIKEYNFQITDIAAIASNALELLRYQFSMGGFAVSFSIPAEPVFILGDADAIVDVILNLLSNAMKYSGERKSILVTVESVRGEAILCVKDSGVGIPADQVSLIFNRFYRINDTASAGGAGLGLSIVEHTVKAHSGRIEVQSTVGSGSSFIIYLPIEQSA